MGEFKEVLDPMILSWFSHYKGLDHEHELGGRTCDINLLISAKLMVSDYLQKWRMILTVYLFIYSVWKLFFFRVRVKKKGCEKY